MMCSGANRATLLHAIQETGTHATSLILPNESPRQMHVHPCIYLHAAVQSHAGIFAPHYVIAAVFDRFGCCVVAECVLMASAIVHSRTHSPLRHFRLTSLDGDSCPDKHLLSQFRCSPSFFFWRPHRLQIVDRQGMPDRLTAS